MTGRISSEWVAGFESDYLLISGFLRKPFVGCAMNINNWALTIALCFLSVAISVVLSLLLSKTETFLLLFTGRISKRD